MINRKYKDRLFSFIFGSAGRKEWTLSLYNAVNRSSYTDPEDIEIMTMEDILYMGMKNDVAFLLADTVDGALDAMPESFVLKKFLIANRAEVKQMCITEYNEAETMEQFRAEGRLEGHKEGIADGDLLRLIRTIYKKMLKGRTNEEIADETEENIDLIGRIEEAILEYKKNCSDGEFDENKALEYYKASS